MYLVDKVSVLQVLNSLLQHRQGLVEVHGQADAAQVLADALLQDRPQADALLLLLGGGQAVPPWGRGLHLPVYRHTSALQGHLVPKASMHGAVVG